VPDSTHAGVPDEALCAGRAIIGLGNPGRRYERTRHNIGFMALDSFATHICVSGENFYKSYYYVKTSHMNRDIILCKPWTYMNCSGDALLDLIEKEALHPSELLVLYDDVALPTGRIRLRRNGGSGGHNGMESIIAALGTNDFPRLRCGIGAPPKDVILTDYVLSPFDDVDVPVMQTMFDRACAAITATLQGGLEQAMNVFNTVEESPIVEISPEAQKTKDFDNIR
jgi:peptidyl-tRNA hydrolase, PTH1 family